MSAQSNASRGGPQGGMGPAVMSSGPQSWDMATRDDTAGQLPSGFNPAMGTMPIQMPGSFNPAMGPTVEQMPGSFNPAMMTQGPSSLNPAMGQLPAPPTVATGVQQGRPERPGQQGRPEGRPGQQAGTCPTCGR